MGLWLTFVHPLICTSVQLIYHSYSSAITDCCCLVNIFFSKESIWLERHETRLDVAFFFLFLLVYNVTMLAVVGVGVCMCKL